MRKEVNWSEMKTGLTEGQKRWTKRAYEEYFGEEIFCVYPMFVEYITGTPIHDLCRDQPVHLHHIWPQSWHKHYLNEDPDYPENIAPICPIHHILGQEDRPIDRDHQEVIHGDQIWARKKYLPGEDPSSYERLQEQRRKHVEKGEVFWVDAWDNFLMLLATEVSESYKFNHPDDPWPTRRR